MGALLICCGVTGKETKTPSLPERRRFLFGLLVRGFWSLGTRMLSQFRAYYDFGYPVAGRSSYKLGEAIAKALFELSANSIHGGIDRNRHLKHESVEINRLSPIILRAGLDHAGCCRLE